MGQGYKAWQRLSSFWRVSTPPLVNRKPRFFRQTMERHGEPRRRATQPVGRSGENPEQTMTETKTNKHEG